MAARSCLPGDQKRDFDLGVVLEAFRSAYIQKKPKHPKAEQFVMQDDNVSDSCCSLLTLNQRVQFSDVNKCYSFVGDSELGANNRSSVFLKSASEQLQVGSQDGTSFSCGSSVRPVQGRSASAALLFDIDELQASAGDDEGSTITELPKRLGKQPHVTPSTISLNSGIITEIGEDIACLDDTQLLNTRRVKVEEYLKGFTELTRFFKLTGPVFTFVARDLTGKISVIKQHMEGDDGEKYEYMDSMIKYEVDEGVVGNKGTNASATRTMLRLHWALEFIIEFMSQLRTVSPEVKTSKLVYDIYNNTLAKHHPWFTRKLAYLAVHTLPSIRSLIDIMCKQDFEEVQVLLNEVVDIGRPLLVYTKTLYTSYDLSNIP